MSDKPKIALSATNPFGQKVVAYQSTLDAHRLKHTVPFSDEDISACISKPTMIARSGHLNPDHKQRFVYYKDGMFSDGGPATMKTVVEHSKKPGVLTSAFRTSKRSQDGAIVYLDPEIAKGLGK